jgi:hypothetical protein
LTIRESAAAATEFRKIIDHKGATWAALRAGPVWFTAAQAGDSARAKQAYSDFFTLRKDADAGLPILLEAGKEYAALEVLIGG